MNCGKVRHVNKGEAKQHLRSLKSAKGYPRGHVYWCGGCEAWHVGTKKQPPNSAQRRQASKFYEHLNRKRREH